MCGIGKTDHVSGHFGQSDVLGEILDCCYQLWQ